MKSLNCEDVSLYSKKLHRTMHIRVYGHYGVPFICFPCQNQKSDDYEKNGMIDTLKKHIIEGKIVLFCLDSNDEETMSSQRWDKVYAAHNLEMYHSFVMNEVVPFVYKVMNGHCYPYLVGISMGGYHAINNFFRRPELYAGFISLSGDYEIVKYFNGYFDDNLYKNSPLLYLKDMDVNDPRIKVYNKKKMISVVGKGIFEHLVLESNYQLRDIACEKKIEIDFHFWDQFNVHDWSSWRYQLQFFIDKILFN